MSGRVFLHNSFVKPDPLSIVIVIAINVFYSQSIIKKIDLAKKRRSRRTLKTIKMRKERNLEEKYDAINRIVDLIKGMASMVVEHGSAVLQKT